MCENRYVSTGRCNKSKAKVDCAFTCRICIPDVLPFRMLATGLTPRMKAVGRACAYSGICTHIQGENEPDIRLFSNSSHYDCCLVGVVCLE